VVHLTMIVGRKASSRAVRAAWRRWWAHRPGCRLSTDNRSPSALWIGRRIAMVIYPLKLLVVAIRLQPTHSCGATLFPTVYQTLIEI
jgi:hypothetical protein